MHLGRNLVTMQVPPLKQVKTSHGSTVGFLLSLFGDFVVVVFGCSGNNDAFMRSSLVKLNKNW